MTPRSLADAIGRISDLASAGGRAGPVHVLAEIAQNRPQQLMQPCERQV